MKIAAIIPARYHSVRFPGKPLTLIAGKTMIERVFLQVQKCSEFSDIIVATDDERIANAVASFGGRAVMTSSEHNSGTERLWEVLKKSDFDAAVNIQGDEPLISEYAISEVARLLNTGNYPVVTPVYFNTSWQDFLSRNIVKAVINTFSQAIYFSRSPIPFTEQAEFKGFYQHLGVYGYLKPVVEAFMNFEKSQLELLEKLEQLRFLDNGVSIQAVLSRKQSLGVDVPGDVQRIEEMLKADA